MIIRRYCASAAVILLIAVAGIAVGAAVPPERINYQGVLRDASDTPLDGDYDIIFGFWSTETGGDEILIDQHTHVSGIAVTVSGGLFNVALGGGDLFDGSGPGTYLSLGQVLRDYADLWLEIDVESETLTPRIKILSAGYALNAGSLDGRPASDFLDTSSTDQVKTGRLVAGDPSGTADDVGMEGYGTFAGGRFADSDGTGYAYVGQSTYGIRGYGSGAGGYFDDTNDSSWAYVAEDEYGIRASGSEAGAYFLNSAGSANARLARHDDYFGIGYGINAGGTYAGGYFYDSDNSGSANVGVGNKGIYASGDEAGGHFVDENSSGTAYAGYGHYGIYAWGELMGGYFIDENDSGYAYVGYGGYGVWGSGNTAGGHFRDANGTGYANVGDSHYGIRGYGETGGAFFEDSNSSGEAYLGYGDYGVRGFGYSAGGYFKDSNHSGLAYVGNGDRGIWAKGTFAGGTFSHPDNTTFWADVSTSTRKITGTGSVSFVQNHPQEPDKVIVYAAPEGDEVATYTRGMARLTAGEARVPLGDTFRWVTNPEIGLTSYLTPHGECNGLYVESLTSTELVVRELGAGTSDVKFDYIVYGLRLGFEEVAVVQRKEKEAFLPTAEAIEAEYRGQAQLRAHNALERFKTMRADAGLPGATDPSETENLIAALERQRTAVLTALEQEGEPARIPEHSQEEIVSGPARHEPIISSAETLPDTADGNIHIRSSHPGDSGFATLMSVVEEVEVGDVLANDLERPGELRRCFRVADAGVVGVVAGEAGSGPGEGANDPTEVPVSLAGVILCKVDAGYGSIRPNDLLSSSPTPGHAMRAVDPIPGTIVGKALEPLETGTGLIKVLVMLK